MKVSILYANEEYNFENRSSIVISNRDSADVVISDLSDNEIIRFVFVEKFNNYVLVNSGDSNNILMNGRRFSKIMAQPDFTIKISNLKDFLLKVKIRKEEEYKKMNNTDVKLITPKLNTLEEIEQKRVSIIKEVGQAISEFKSNISTCNISNLVLNVAIFALSVVSSFGVTNLLLGLKVDNSSSVLNLTTNFGFLTIISVVVLAVSLLLKQGVFALLESKSNKKFGASASKAPHFIIGITSVFLFVVYVLNLFYFNSIKEYKIVSLFIAFLFVGSLFLVAIGSGYFKHQLSQYTKLLTSCEYREDFESVMKSYRAYISNLVNSYSENKINNVKSNLVNHQIKMVFEAFIGILTAPFLAYGVSNTLASCFPEAANWVRISGLRFSPIFLVLATFLIVFAFFSFVRSFTLAKQIKSSEVIKFDGFHDYNSHGVNILGLDAIRTLEKEKKVVFLIACFIILIEFTMNVSYFITEIGGDIQGLFLSIVTALVPTALLIAETHLLSATMHKISNYNDLLSMLD